MRKCWRSCDAGADWVQIDEPCLVLDLDEATGAALTPRLCASR
jgi:hypothetical protein